MNKWMMSVVGLCVAGLIGCDSKDSASTPPAAAPAAQTPASEASTALPAGLVLSDAPAGAKDVKAVRTDGKAGDQVVVRGIVAGRAEPIAQNRAVFTLLDASIATCDKTEGDACKTPWDACCEPADSIAANSLTVQVVDADGKPLKTGLTGVGNLAPLKEVTVVGTFRPSPDGKAAVVDATGMVVK